MLQRKSAVRVLLHVARDRTGTRRLTEVAVLDRDRDNTCCAVPAWQAGRGMAIAGLAIGLVTLLLGFLFMAGGGIKPGITYGATDELGYHVAENKVHVHDLQATILH